MSEEELQKALKIMTAPITVERIKNFKYTFFDNSGDEESFTLEDYLDLSNKVYDLERENQQLKDKLKGVQEERDYLFNKTSVENKYLQQDRDKYKEVIEDVREYIEKEVYYCLASGDNINVYLDKLLQILDKVKEVK